MNYYIADCHFGHKGVLLMDPRPFADVEQMEETMVMLWNAAVYKTDTVYIIGDFCWGKVDEWRRILRKLNGTKVLIKGNHDLGDFPADVEAMFADIKDKLEIVDYDKKGNARKVILNHYPEMFYKHSCNEKYFMLCGHVHTTAENDWLEKWTKELQEARRNNPGFSGANCGQIYNVGAMMPWMNYTPRTLDEIIRQKAEWEANRE